MGGFRQFLCAESTLLPQHAGGAKFIALGLYRHGSESQVSQRHRALQGREDS